MNRNLNTIMGLFAVAACATLAHAAGDALSCPAVSGDATTIVDRQSVQEDLFTRPETSVAAQKRTLRRLYLTATDAYDMVTQSPAKILFIDVRTRGELQFIGMPTAVDAHVPFMMETTPLQWDDASSSFRLAVNPDFVDAVDKRLAQKGLTRSDVVIAICQGGVRAARAVDTLTRAGYSTVYTVIDGFEGDPVTDGANKGLRLVNGWRNAGLPWTTRLDRTKMYGMD